MRGGPVRLAQPVVAPATCGQILSGIANIRLFREAIRSMGANHDEIQQILDQRGVIARRDHPHLAGSLDRCLRAGQIRAVLPGVYADPSRATTFGTRILALMADVPDAVLIDGAAAKLSFWPDLRVTEVSCAVTTPRVSRPGYRFVKRSIPPEFVAQRQQVRMTHPALTALDLCPTLGGEPIDQALRTRTATLRQMRRALELTRARCGNTTRRMLLLDSRDEPWSEAERLCHRLLRAAGLSGWRANFAVQPEGSVFYIDVAFRSVRLAIEIDGRLHETKRDVFENDRWRQNALVLDGWTVLRFTWRMLTEHPDVVIETIRQALGQLAR